MLRKIDNTRLGTSDLGWLRSRFHFSFAEYRDPENIHFGALRVLNDDLVEPGHGFEMHPHSDFEIVSYVVDGALTHRDSMGNAHTLTRGQVQYMSAGTGVLHSEHNLGDQTLRFLQIWIFPDEKGHEPAYGDHRFDWETRKDRWLPIASGPGGDAPVTIHQDVRISAVELGAGHEIGYAVAPDRQAYLLQIEGASAVNSVELHDRDALEIVAEDVVVKAATTSHLLLIEMARPAHGRRASA
jgi:redox-sensitive bicupin YhaK (pirin superfamily)